MTDHSIPKEGDAVIAPFLNDNGISINVANSSNFGHMIDENVVFSKQNYLQGIKHLLESEGVSLARSLRGFE